MLNESFDFAKKGGAIEFNKQFSKRVNGEVSPIKFINNKQDISLANKLMYPDFIIALKQKYYWNNSREEI